MSDKLTPENLNLTFRCYRGEAENPYSGMNDQNAKAWETAWQLEKIVSQKTPEEIVELWSHADEYESEDGEKGVPAPLADSDIPENEKAVAFAVFSVADTFMTEDALSDYIKWPVVEQES